MSRSSRINPIFRKTIPHHAAVHAAFAAAHGEDPGWLIDLRAEALARFSELGFPSPRLEEWKSTSSAPIAKVPFELAPLVEDPRPVSLRLAPGTGVTSQSPDPIAIVNGVCAFTPERADVRIEGLAALRADSPERLSELLRRPAEPKDRSFRQLNGAFFDDGAVVTIPARTSAQSLVHLLVHSETRGERPVASHPRIFVEAEPGSRATVLIDQVTLAEAPTLTNWVADVFVGANATLDLVILERGDDAAFTVGSLACRVDRDARLNVHTLTLGGALVRNDLEVLLADEGSECSLRGLFVATGEDHIDNHTSVDHAMPHGTSRELYKGILGGRAKGVFRGVVIVRPGAQKTDATQSNPNLLLDRGAEVDTKPQLEIHADDVKCAHGATIGQLDPDALFYLRSRGIGEVDARELLVRAFAAEISEAVPGEELSSALSEIVMRTLQRITGGAR